MSSPFDHSLGSTGPARAALAALSLLLVACGSGGGPAAPTKPADAAKASDAAKPADSAKPAAGKPANPNNVTVLRVAAAPGPYGDSLTKHVSGSFEQQTGLKVEFSPGISTEIISKLRASGSTPIYDVVEIGEVVAVTGRAENIFAKTNRSNLPNFGQIEPGFASQEYGATNAVQAVALMVNKDKVRQPITSWDDLWKPEFRGQVVVPDITNNLGLLLLVHTARANGGSTENMEPGFQKMAELKPNIGYMHKGIGADVEDRVASGEFSIAIVEAHRPILAAEKGAPVRLDVPSEGAFALPFTLEVVANTPAKDLAEYYINIAFTPEAQRGFAEDGLFSPTLRGVQIPDSVKDKVVPTNKLLPFDWDILAANRPAWTERWNREVQP